MRCPENGSEYDAGNVAVLTCSVNYSADTRILANLTQSLTWTDSGGNTVDTLNSNIATTPPQGYTAL